MFGFQSSSPLGNVTLNPANKNTDLSLSDFQTGIGVPAYATLNVDLHISCIRTVLVDTIASLQDSDGEVMPVVEGHELLRFMIFWILPYQTGLGIQLVFLAFLF